MKYSWNTSEDMQKIKMAQLIAVPMHGQVKLSSEGYRTRDGHFIEWFGKKLDSHVAVVSRPDPLPFFALSTKKRKSITQNTVDVSTPTVRVPKLQNRRLWWIDSVNDYPPAIFDGLQPLVAWNPFIGLAKSFSSENRAIHFDILDDWTNHFAFEGMRDKVVGAYGSMFERASSVSANSEATLALAHRFGRDDAVLITNGCDPDRFTTKSSASSEMTVGYVGKIGRRLDLDLIISAAQMLPNIKFIFAGPFLDREYFKPMRIQPNIVLLGDVHYSDVPKLLTTFDVGWVPHRLGEGEVGGDVIKTYEYRAAGLPVLTTPVLGAGERGLSEVHVLNASEHVAQLQVWRNQGPRIVRIPEVIPAIHRWEHKANTLLSMMGLK